MSRDYLIELSPNEVEALKWRTENSHRPVGAPHCQAVQKKLGVTCYRRTHQVQGKTRRYLRHNARRRST